MAFYVISESRCVLSFLLLAGVLHLGVGVEAEGGVSLHVTKRGNFVHASRSEEAERQALLDRADHLLHFIRDGQSGSDDPQQLAKRPHHDRNQKYQRAYRQQKGVLAEEKEMPQREPEDRGWNEEIDKRVSAALASASQSPGTSEAGHTHRQSSESVSPEAGEELVEKLRVQYEQMSNTFETAQLEAKALHSMYVATVGLQSDGAFIALACGGFVAFSLVTACAVLLQGAGTVSEHWEDSSMFSFAWLPKHGPLQMLSLAWTFLSSVQCMMMLPMSFGLPQNMEYSSTSKLQMASSVLLILVSALGARRLMCPWVQARNRAAVIGFIVGHFGVALLYAAANDSFGPLRLGADICGVAILLSRLGLCVCASFANVFLMMAVKVTPQESMMQFCLYRSSMMCLGASAGALLASSAAVWVSVLPWMLLGCVSMAVLPQDLEPLLAKLTASEDARNTLTGALKADKLDESDVLASRKMLWIVGAAAILMRAFLTTAFQTTAAAIYVGDFLFSAPDVLLAAGASLACGAFVVPLILIVKHAGKLDLGRVTTWAVACVALAVVLLFRPLLVLFSSETSGLWLAFLANAVALPAVYLMSGILEGIALQQAVPESTLSQENLVTAGLILQDGVVRAVGPPAMMCLYTLGGRNLCAMALLAIAGIATKCSFNARGALANISFWDIDLKQASIGTDAALAEPKDT